MGSRTCVGRARGRALPPRVRNANEACRPRSRPRGRVCASAERRGEPRVCTGLRVQRQDDRLRRNSLSSTHIKIDGSKTQQIPQIVLRSVGTGEAGRTQPRRSRVRSSSGCPIRRRAPPPALPDAHVARRRDGESRANLGAPSMRREMVRLPLRASDARARPPDAPIRGVRVETTTPTPPPPVRHPQGVPRARGG